MRVTCRKSCGVCGPYGPACERLGEAAVSPGDMDVTFQRALEDFPQYSPQLLHKEPWVLRFDDFLSAAEADHIVSLCADSFQRSLAGDRVSSVRTSDQCWCNWGTCLEDPVIQAVERRISEVTRVPVVNGEFMQIVRYGEGQFCARARALRAEPPSPRGAPRTRALCRR
jgi:prolyl 4-hydroxylase